LLLVSKVIDPPQKKMFSTPAPYLIVLFAEIIDDQLFLLIIVLPQQYLGCKRETVAACQGTCIPVRVPPGVTDAAAEVGKGPAPKPKPGAQQPKH
jgi:hypothetical protein